MSARIILRRQRHSVPLRRIKRADPSVSGALNVPVEVIEERDEVETQLDEALLLCPDKVRKISVALYMWFLDMILARWSVNRSG